jgi:hypothetical protein
MHNSRWWKVWLLALAALAGGAGCFHDFGQEPFPYHGYPTHPYDRGKNW